MPNQRGEHSGSVPHITLEDIREAVQDLWVCLGCSQQFGWPPVRTAVYHHAPWRIITMTNNGSLMVHSYTKIAESNLTSSMTICYHCQGQGQTAACRSLCWEGDWLQSASPPGPDPEASRDNCVQDYCGLTSGRKDLYEINIRQLHNDALWVFLIPYFVIGCWRLQSTTKRWASEGI